MTSTKVIHDISVLGSSLYNPKARTGVARVIENLALELKRENDVELSFCAFQSLEQYLQLLVNHDATSLLENVSLQYSEHPLAKKVVDVIGKIYSKPTPGEKKRLERRILSVLLKTVDLICGGCDFGNMSDMDIFHSTYYPFPESVKGDQKFQRFITVYDLIPILYPQYFGGKKNHLAHRIVKCISPDDWVITISESTKNDLCDFAQIDRSKVFVTPLAASDMFYRCTDSKHVDSVKTHYKIPEGDYILSLCTLEPRKNIDQVIRSFIRLVQDEHIVDLNLLLVGTKGWNFDKIFDEIAHASFLKDRIVVTGYVPDTDIAALYSGAMMFVYPSFYEGFGLPPLEAMQCGVPVITSNTSSLPEVVGNAGIMVDPTDEEGLSQAMWSLYSQSALRESLSTKSLEHAKFFSWKKCARQTIKAYQTALDI